MNVLFWMSTWLISFLSSLEPLQADDKTSAAGYNARIDQWVSITSLRDQNRLREVCESLSRSQKVAIILDRRLDPNQPINLPPPIEGSVIEVLTRIAASQNAKLRQMGDALLLLTGRPAEKLRTVVALRTAELRAKNTSALKNIRFEANQIQRIMNRHRWQWNDLARPRELAVGATESSHLKIENPEMIPHDLWYHGELPRAHMIEFLSFILIQYDLTFSWKNKKTISIHKVPDRVMIEQKYRNSKILLSRYRDQLLKEFPQSEWKQQGSRFLVSGSIELHEKLKALLENKQVSKASNRIPWKKRRFTMRVVRKPLEEVLNFLISSGLPIHFNKEQINSLEIDPEQLISFETRDADAKQLMEAICKPVKLPFYITEDEIQIGRSEK